MALAHLRGCVNIEVYNALEGLGFKVYMAVVGYIEPEVDTLVDGETCDQTMLVVNMGAQGTYAVGRENVILHR